MTASTTKALKGWFTSGVGVEIREGYDVTMDFNGTEPFRWHVTEMKPDRVHWNCLAGSGSAKDTTVTYLLTGEGQAQTVVDCDHDGWPEGHEAYATCNTLWSVLIGKPRPAFA